MAEQAIFSPVVIDNEFVINTVIPVSPLAKALFCSNPPTAGFTMALQMSNGGSATQSFLPTPDNNFPTTFSVVGLGDGAVGTPAPLIGDPGNTSIVSGSSAPNASGQGQAIQRNTNFSGGVGLRLNWTKVR